MQQLPQDKQKTQLQRFYRHELEELAQTRDALRTKYRPDEYSDSGSDYNSLSDHDGGDSDKYRVEAADMSTHIPASNVGYKLLLKMGWKAGTGLGQNATGRTAPIPIERKQDVLGLGKQEVDTWYNESSTAKRKTTEVERQAEETEEERIKREKQVEQKRAIQAELEMVKSAFYCALCDKQYERISDFEVHLSSYDHNHKKRFKEMKDTSRAGAASTTSKIKEKERRREERELAKMQEAAMKRAGTMGSNSPLVQPGLPVQAQNAMPVAIPTTTSSAASTGFQPINLSGFQPVSAPENAGGSGPTTLSTGTSGFQPVKMAGLQPVKVSGFQPVKVSGLQPAEDGPETSTSAGVNTSTAAAAAPSPSGFQPVKLGGFKPMKIGGFQLKKPGNK